jgi:hypothetical protein
MYQDREPRRGIHIITPQDLKPGILIEGTAASIRDLDAPVKDIARILHSQTQLPEGAFTIKSPLLSEQFKNAARESRFNGLLRDFTILMAPPLEKDTATFFVTADQYSVGRGLGDQLTRLCHIRIFQPEPYWSYVHITSEGIRRTKTQDFISQLLVETKTAPREQVLQKINEALDLK